MTLIIIGGVAAYLIAGLAQARGYYQANKNRRSDVDEEVIAACMIPFWPIIQIGRACIWIVGHEPPKNSQWRQLP